MVMLCACIVLSGVLLSFELLGVLVLFCVGVLCVGFSLYVVWLIVLGCLGGGFFLVAGGWSWGFDLLFVFLC